MFGVSVSDVSLSQFSYFTSLLYFSYIIIFFLPFSFRTTPSSFVKIILQLFIQILNIKMYFEEKTKVK